MAANGFRAVRTHVDTTLDSGLANVEALVEVRRRLAGVIDIEIVALADHPISRCARRDRGPRLVREALAAGADLVGGCPHLEPNGDTLAATEALLEIAPSSVSASTYTPTRRSTPRSTVSPISPRR